MALIGMPINWILEGDFKRKFKVLKEQKAILIFMSIFIIHVIGLIYTQDFTYGIKDIKIKLPLFSLPLIIGTSAFLSFKELKIIFSFFIVSVFVKTLYGLFLLSGFSDVQIGDMSQLAGSFSHIRYALLINIAIFSAFYFSIISTKETSKIQRVLFLALAIWLMLFLFILKSLTGIVVLIIMLMLFAIIVVKKIDSKKVKIFISTFISLFFIIMFMYSYWVVNKYYTTDKNPFSNLEEFTSQNNKYKHIIDSKSRENGHFVNIYICKKELKQEWNKRSKIKYGESDNMNQNISSTLIRYLTSKGYRKDAGGVLKLTQKDVLNIENGMTNYIFENKYSLYNKFYVALWELEVYTNGGSPERHSITQRFEFLKVSLSIIKDNFIFGVGTGDVKQEFSLKYEELHSKLKGKYRLRAHNQFVTFFIAFGVIGFLYIVFVLFYVPFTLNKYKDYLFIFIFVILLLSMFNEDTLENQIGVIMFSYFISITLFSYKGVLSEIEN